MNPPVVLAVAGTDSGGAAGLAADLATFSALGVHGAMVVAAVTAQDTTGVTAIHAVPADVVAAQLEAVLADLPVAAVKTGMLGSLEAVALVTRACAGRVLVVDPVLRATSGADLATDAVVAAYRDVLLPVATVITPNAAEAGGLLGLDSDDPMHPAALATGLTGLGPAVVVTGGPEVAGAETCTDWLALPGAEPVAISHPAVATTNDHGTGCTYSSALASYLALGEDLKTSCARAAAYVSNQLDISKTWTLGRGRGPVAHTHKEIA
ncbi:bifunctional hydroxymethylpyrimidine kinase/phosphomethylpyrimidine kinase [Nocardioides kongjuensis]|uniref:Hydroxymethylpyrimidine/phosphomethylpyrimidine kinase n=1 Tax=Nocardioides kongjuensis TaxID=349522 RepID=A0A852RFW5_9ACTN|nr:hydroxymethylpyrimidine/phosphomethylpyrimidine kinase [Nocardioides kongjuensis]